MFWIELIILLACIVVGARIGGLGLGVMGGVGLAIFVYIFGLQPATAPIDVMLMILSVVTTAGCLQATGGMDYLVSLAERILRSHPKYINFLAPIIAYLFTFLAGTGHVAYAILPVIAEVSRECGERPERSMSVSVIASQQAITACPISAATVAMVALLDPFGISLPKIMMICVPATFIGVMIAALVSNKMGKELKDDPVYLKRLQEKLIDPINKEKKAYVATKASKISCVLFLCAALFVVLMGTFSNLRPGWMVDGKFTRMGMPVTIEIIMLTAAACILLICKGDVEKVVSGSVFKAGAAAVVAIFGIAWMGDTFFQGNAKFITGNISTIVHAAPWLFVFALFILSILLYSQAATVQTLMPLGITLGINPALLAAMFPAVNGYFFIPNYPTVVAALNFDTTGTTHVGKYLLNHSFMLPGLISTACAVGIGMLSIHFLL
ncbi:MULTISPECIES: anaerobic C4-dicarboxylate transporter family protein [unclassified Sporolactobacillus]|uniref:anaerobic C4-dicarboxylate transporter family protein n=1 Tax=unclassified Sporolactobacillus TaxID=2628533 RepID=UPI0023675F9E|nr:anaerobic C4-dicarboxylate transporter [Sporolactobacillus sp. CQH2019]MDD9148193.1 anaerobic C4-dicarboxylate transporter [Sporolactobacillus sp. CQH2019]